MSKHIVSRLLQVCGPCRILHTGAENDNLLRDLLLAGCDGYAFGPSLRPHPRWLGPKGHLPEGPPLDAMLVDITSSSGAANILRYYFDRFGTPKTLVLRALGFDRKMIETQLFETTWRRHPGGMAVHEYAGLLDDVLGELSFYERIPEPALARSAADMLRESGCRADAHIVRYALAAQFARPGDTILDCPCGPGYGTAILASLSNGATFIGVEPDEPTVEYARANYTRDGVTFQAGDASHLKGIPDSSIDLVVSLETAEHPPDWTAAVKEFHRVLKPDGRVVAVVPDHQLDQQFFVELRYTQSDAARSLRPIPLDAAIDADWLITVASKNPIEGQGRTDFEHPGFHASFEMSGAAIVDFAQTYDNPYLYRTMVQMGERLRHDLKLATLAQWIVTNARPDSADRGAAICVLGYQVLEKRELAMVVPVLDFIRDYLRVTADEQNNRHVLRWRLSLAFLAGRLCELAGDRDKAASWYHAVPTYDWRNFSPILATKTVAACFFEGRIRLSTGDLEQAKACFSRGLSESLAALQGNLNDIVGNPEQPIPFGLTELAEVIDMGSQCANAIANLPLWHRDPGLFWKQVDVKRFGLASWAKDLERENQELRARLAL